MLMQQRGLPALIQLDECEVDGGLHCRGITQSVLFNVETAETFTDDTGDWMIRYKGMKGKRGEQHDDCKWQMWHCKIKNNSTETNQIIILC